MKKWMITAKRADFNRIGEIFHIDPVTARLIRNRDIIGEERIEEYLYGSMINLHDPKLMLGMKEAVTLILKKIQDGKKIRIIGDYDIDGVTATYILLKGLRRCGAKVDYEIPDRIRDGYGINEMLVREAAASGIDTIITCDNGISALEQIRLGKELGMTMIITDHHELRTACVGKEEVELIPEADVVVNPHQKNCPYPYKQLCGAVIAYKLIQCLYELFHIPDKEMEEFVEFAAIATVGDVCDLTGENRIIVREGLLLLKTTENIGLRALIAVNGLEDKDINSYHIGFVIGPCINASGRLDTAKKALRLFMTEHESEAKKIAEELFELNNQRKEMTLQGYERAVKQIEEEGLIKDRVLVIYLPDCHESLAGIIAGRIRERYYKPVFVLTDGDHLVKGSGRSIEAYSMFAEMQKCDELFENYGGHPMAAGCSLKRENVERLRMALNKKTTLTEEELVEKIHIDVPMPVDYVSERLIEELSLLEPFGKGNEKPIFADKNLKVLGARVLGQNKNVLKLKICSSENTTMDALYFGDIDVFTDYLEEKYSYDEVRKMFQNRENQIRLSVIYYPQINEYRDMRSIQIVIKEYQ